MQQTNINTVSKGEMLTRIFCHADKLNLAKKVITILNSNGGDYVGDEKFEQALKLNNRDMRLTSWACHIVTSKN